MSIRTAVMTLSLAIVAALLSVNAGAQQGRGGPCAQDAKKFCGEVQKGQGAIAKCMNEHQAELSPACRESIEARKAKAERAREDCRPDIEKFCKGIEPGGGRIVACLRSKHSELSPACAEDLKRRGGRRRPQ